MKKVIGFALLASLAISGAVFAQMTPTPLVTVQLPTVQAIQSNDAFQDIVGGAPGVGNQYATAAQVGNYSPTLPGNNAEDALIGSDFTTNLFQRATTAVLASPAAVAYTAPDRWFTWGGTNTPVTLSKQTGSTDVGPGFGATLRVNKASGTGTAQVCVAQEIETQNSFRFQGQTVEFDLGHVKAGPAFSAVNSTLAAYILTGTGTDEGSVNAAFSINAGGGGSSGWTGATLFGGTAGYQVPITTSFGRYTVTAPMPVTETEIAVAICWTPVGTGTVNDWFEFGESQFVPNSALTSVAGSNGAVLAVNDVRAKSFSRRLAGVEVLQQQRYAYSIAEGTITAGTIMAGAGNTPSATTCAINIPFPDVMRAAPTYTNALTATTFKLNAAAASVVLSTPFSATTGVNTPANASITFTASGLGATAGFSCELVSAAGGGLMVWSAEL